MSKEITEIMRKNWELKLGIERTENERLEDYMIQQTAQHESERIARKMKVIELQDKLKLQKAIDHQKIELEETKVIIENLILQRASLTEENQELLSKTAWSDTSEESLKLVSVAAPLHEGVAAQEQSSENLESLRQQVAALKVRCGALILKVMKYVKSAALKGECHHLIQDSSSKKLTPDANDEDEFPPETRPATEQGEQKLRIRIGKHDYLVSDPKFFKIDWTEEYEYRASKQFICLRCRKQSANVHYLQDHIWCEHYGERFECAYCKDHHKSYVFRSTIRAHMHAKHPGACQCVK